MSRQPLPDDIMQTILSRVPDKHAKMSIAITTANKQLAKMYTQTKPNDIEHANKIASQRKKDPQKIAIDIVVDILQSGKPKYTEMIRDTYQSEAITEVAREYKKTLKKPTAHLNDSEIMKLANNAVKEYIKNCYHIQT